MIRLFVILLALLVSSPVAAMTPVCAPAAHIMPMPDDSAHHSAKALPHQCFGCVPIGDWLTPRIVAGAVPIAPPPIARIARLTLTNALPPALPPPRRG